MTLLLHLFITLCSLSSLFRVPNIENLLSCGHKLHLCCWLTLLTENAWSQIKPTFFSSLTHSKYTIDLWPSSSLMRASTRTGNETLHPPPWQEKAIRPVSLVAMVTVFLRMAVSFMERIQVEGECSRGVNLGKMSLSRTSSSWVLLLFICSAPIVAGSAP